MLLASPLLDYEVFLLSAIITARRDGAHTDTAVATGIPAPDGSSPPPQSSSSSVFLGSPPVTS
ncbi:MAG: hypothetical protein H0U22_06845 [Geodermatophilaceae bacterium]|nr:hypothetical protein [Geodermatophilaceae bacterium]